jgi:hypothetical protein
MKILSFFLFLGLTLNSVKAQNSEDFIPIDAVTVFSINNFTLLQKVSLDDLVKYEFMQELQQELFDGSTSGKTIKESGIDFNQKLNVFYGRNDNFEISGFSFGIKDENQLFTVFDDFDKQVSPFENLEFYSSYFNHLIIRGKVGLLVRIDPLNGLVNEIADSIWFANGNEYFERYPDDYDDSYEDGYEEFPEEEVLEPAEEIDVFEMEEEEIFEPEIAWESDDDISQKNYNELRDSIFAELNQEYLMQVCKELFVEGKNLKKEDKALAAQLSHTTEGVFYLDNSRNVKKAQPFWYYQQIMPSLTEQLSQLYSNNKILGDIVLNNNSIEVQMTANYNDALGSIYKELNDSKFDKNVTKYIHKDNSAYFTYNVDLAKAYEKTYETIMPILREEKSRNIATSVLAIELLHLFLDKEAIFDTYKGSMFGTFNGVKMVSVKRLVFEYDDDFNYTEKEVYEDEEVPVFTLGFSTKRPDVPTLVMEQMAKLNSEWQNMGNYWKVDNAVLNSLPLYIINKNGLFILTNDEDLALNHNNGYGSNKISRKQIKNTKKSGFVYGQIDWSKTIQHMPKKLLTPEQIDVLNALQTKTGSMVLTSSKTTTNHTDFKLVYDFKESQENPGKYLLDMVNSLYVLMK